MASVHRLGNSLAAVIPAQAARQLGLQFKTQILVFVSENEIRIRNAKLPNAGDIQPPVASTTLVVEKDEPW